MLKSTLIAGALLAAAFPFTSFAQSPSVDDVIESYITDGVYNSASSPCSGVATGYQAIGLAQYSRRKSNGIAKQVNRGDSYTLIGGKILQTLNAVSYCYKEQGRPVSDTVNISSDMASLLIYRLKGKQSLSVNQADLDNARRLTAYATANGIDMRAETAALKSFDGPKAAPQVSLTEELDFNAVATEFKNNSFRVAKKYSDKTVIGSGKIYKVKYREASRLFPGSKDEVSVVYDGPKTFTGGGSSGELLEAIFVTCKIKAGSASEDKAVDLNKGDTVKVQGVFKMSGVSYIGPSIENCEIL